MKVNFEEGFAVGFRMAVAECFKDSLAKGRFNAGDIIYDDKRAYLSPWSLAIKHIAYGIQIKQMLKEEVEYTVLRKNSDGSSLMKEKTVKQPIGDFLNILRTGI